MKITSGQLVQQLSTVFDMESKTLTVFARNLREAGWIPTGGRGPSAAEMSPREAAILVLAMLVTDRPAIASDAVKVFGSFIAGKTEKSDGCVYKSIFDFLNRDQSKSLLDVLEALIEAYASPEKIFALDLAGEKVFGSADWQLPIIVEVSPSMLGASVNIGGAVTTFGPTMADENELLEKGRLLLESDNSEPFSDDIVNDPWFREAFINAAENEDWLKKSNHFGKGIRVYRQLRSPELSRLGAIFRTETYEQELKELCGEHDSPPRRA